MKKERIKSIILILLIANCVQLTGQIWLNEKLWPSGYNFFRSLEDLPLVGAALKWFDRPEEDITGSMLYVSAVQPRKLVINGGVTREVYTPDHALYPKTMEYSRDILSALLTDVSRSTTISAEQYQAMFKGKSIYLDFGFFIDSANLAQFCDSSTGGGLAFPTISGALLAPDTVSNQVQVCVQDQSGSVTKYWVSASADDLLNYIDRLPIGEQQGYTFAFELNLHRPTPEQGAAQVQQKVVLDPFVLLPMNPSHSGEITITNPLTDIETIGQAADQIVTAFGYKPSSLRKTVTREGVVTYVENSATVRVHPSGLVEYNAVTAGQGIPLSGSGLTAQQAVSGVLDIAKTVWKQTDTANIPELHLQTDLINSKNNSYTVGISYYHNGMPILSASQNGSPAIYAVIQDGRIQTLRMLLLSYQAVDSKH